MRLVSAYSGKRVSGVSSARVNASTRSFAQTPMNSPYSISRLRISRRMNSRRVWVLCVSQAVATVAEPPTSDPSTPAIAVAATLSIAQLLLRAVAGRLARARFKVARDRFQQLAAAGELALGARHEVFESSRQRVRFCAAADLYDVRPSRRIFRFRVE